MEPETIKTADMFLSAYLMVENIPIIETGIERREKEKVIFAFPKDKAVLRLIDNFRLGTAKVNVQDLKAHYQNVQEMRHETSRNRLGV